MNKKDLKKLEKIIDNINYGQVKIIIQKNNINLIKQEKTIKL